ncbi:MAG: type VI secretion system-associated FHA domain protein TagH [Rhodocyclaceae bacterium]|nr:type VI secretion system-associated FHA domain protein TagH [Rhodocyclaceae bacterium]MBX3668191.1 type VI secretion system-associated FHA domain protein TagH [Rhodocyclaceae bacterium]
MELTLIILGPEHAEPHEVVVTEQQAVIGRDPACTVVLPDPEKHLSRNHITIDYSGSGYTLTVSSRVNAVYVNDAAYRMGQSVALGDGDRIWMPPYEIRTRISQPAPPAAAPGRFLDTALFDFSVGESASPGVQPPAADPLNVADFLAPPPAAIKPDQRDAFELRDRPATPKAGGLLDGLDMAPPADFDLLHTGGSPRAATPSRPAPLAPGMGDMLDPGAKSINDILNDGGSASHGTFGALSPGVEPVIDLGQKWGGPGASALDHVHDINLPLQAPPAVSGSAPDTGLPAPRPFSSTGAAPPAGGGDELLADLDHLLGDLIQPAPGSPAPAASQGQMSRPVHEFPTLPPNAVDGAGKGAAQPQWHTSSVTPGRLPAAGPDVAEAIPAPEPGLFDDLPPTGPSLLEQIPAPEAGLFDDLLAPAAPQPDLPRAGVQHESLHRPVADPTIASRLAPSVGAASPRAASAGTGGNLERMAMPAVPSQPVRGVPPAQSEPPHESTHPGWNAPGATQKTAAQADGGAADKLLAEILAGLGLKELSLSPDQREQFLRNVGEVARAAIEGIVKLLSSRTLLKQELRVAERTMLAKRDNNPLKMIEHPDEAVRYLFDLRQSLPGAFMRPVPAIRDACDDLCAHEVGLVAGVRAAVAASLKRFNPAQYEEQVAKGPTSLLSNKRAKSWDLFLADYNKMEADSADNIDRLFERDFLSAYMDQVKRLRK